MSHSFPVSKPGAALTVVLLTLTVVVMAGLGVGASPRREFQVSAHKYGYTVAGSDQPVIRVLQGDIVRITFSSDDIPHSFTIDEPYRISKRAQPGRPVTIEFVADNVSPPEGFPIRCALTIDDHCKAMTARLIVEAKRLIPAR